MSTRQRQDDSPKGQIVPTECNQSSRRRFLAQSGKVAAASVLAGVSLPGLYAAGNNTIRLALVGCGGRGTGAVADAFSTKGGPVKLCAMADLFEHRLKGSLDRLRKAHADKVDVPKERQFIGFDAYKKAIDCLGRGDVVLLTTHAAFRPLHFEYAVSKGVNVFMEKSFATDIDKMTFETPAPIHSGANGIYAAPQPGITKEV